MNRDRLLVARDLLIILAVVAGVVLFFQPGLRRQLLALAPGGVRQEGERAGRWLAHEAGRLPWSRQEPQPAEPNPTPAAPEPEPSAEPAPDTVSPESEAEPDRDKEPEPESAQEPQAREESPQAPRDEEPVSPAGNLPPRLPAIREQSALSTGLKELQSAAESRPSAAAFRKLADGAAAAGFPSVAAEAYQQEAAVYRRLGDPNAAAVETLKAGRYRAEGTLYLHAPRSETDPPRLARLEPREGVLIGAFIDRDERLPTSFLDENWQTHREPSEFAELVGKKPATLFCYLEYGKPFPKKWAERLKEQGVIPHLAWEPRRLTDVADDDYLDRFAADVARLDFPVFLRFAGEMNGEWTPYHGNPSLYRQKFRLVHQVISTKAPKAALIWCVNNVPDANIDDYYPGDDAVDWVGVNLYNVLYLDNLRSRPGDKIHPVDLLQSVYTRYSRRKPIAICEYAASHQAAIDPKPRPEVAVTRLSQLYAALPRLFPRVKMINWFDCNNLVHARAGRQLNNFSLTEDEEILHAYSRAVKPGYFLTGLEASPAETIRPLRANDAVSGVVTLSAWVRCHEERPRVYLLADDEVLYAGSGTDVPVARWDTGETPEGKHRLRLLVLDDDNRKILDRTETVVVRR